MVVLSNMLASSAVFGGPVLVEASASPPASRLVGVELNPGPPKKGARPAPGMKKKKTGRSGGLGASVSSGLSTSGTVAAGYSSSLRNIVRFGRGSTEDSMRVEFCVPVCQIGNSGTSGNYALKYADGTFNSLAGLVPSGLSPTWDHSLVYWQNSAINSISQAFSRYTTRKLRFEYRPQSTSTQADQLVFGFSSDPLNPLLGYTLGATTADNLLGLSESIPFAPWNAWTLPVRHDSAMKYISQADLEGGSGGTAEARLTMSGSFGCVAENTAIVAPVTYGVLYLCGEFDFHDLNPIVLLSGSDPGRQRVKKIALPSLPPLAAPHSCASSSPCLQCGVTSDYVSVTGVKTPVSL
jgi:hypothetical protein